MNKELEALERIKQSHFTAMSCLGIEDKEAEQAIKLIETALKDYEKKFKALEIIAEKDVDIYGIKNSIDVYDYNAGIAYKNDDDFEDRLLTQEEYDLLKEVLP